MNYAISYAVAASIIAAVITGFYFGSPKLLNRQGRIFSVITVDVLLASVLDVVSCLLIGHASDGLMTGINLLYLLSLHLLPCLMFLYSLVIAERRFWKTRGLKHLLFLPYLIEAGFFIVSPVTRLVFYVEDGVYYHGPLFGIVYLVATLYIVASCVTSITAARLEPRKKWATMSFTVLLLVAVTIQFFAPNYLLIDFGAALSLLIHYIVLQSFADFSDSLTSAYNQNALTTFINEAYADRKSFYLFGFSVNAFRHINNVYGDASGDMLLKQIVVLFGRLFGGRTVRLYGDHFCVFIKGRVRPETILENARAIPKVFRCHEYQIAVEGCKVLLNSRDFRSASQILSMLDFAFDMAREEPEQTLLVDERLIEKHAHMEKTREALQRALKNRSVDVWYQPVVDAVTGKTVAAEALARIHDPHIGSVSPAEFIPLAEKEGMILELGACVRAKVWAFLQKYDIAVAGIDHVSINLSAVECTQRDVMQAILREAAEAQVNCDFINLEVTETAAVESPEVLRGNMNLLRERHFAFHMDDYGTGYAGLTNLLALPFTVVKFDRSMLALAHKNERGQMIGKLVDTLHSAQIGVVCEGVETEEEWQTVRGWGADFIQGFFFSRPMPPEQFAEFAQIPARF